MLVPEIGLEVLRRLVGFAPTDPDGLSARILGGREAAHTVVEDLVLQRKDGEPIPAFLTRPAAPRTPSPAVLYCHAHGHRTDIGRRELVDGRAGLAEPAYGPALAARGFVALSLDMPSFGDRAETSESALYKRQLWRGGTMMGLMLSDLACGLDYLQSRTDVDGTRIATLGMSMGGTHAYWLAALDGRVGAAAHLCCFAAMAALVRSGAHDLHSHYMTVPGLLQRGDFGAVAGLVAPRPQLIGVGLKDPLTPPNAFDQALSDVQARYRAFGRADRLTVVVEPRTGHEETARMRGAVLDFLDSFAAGDARAGHRR